MDGGVPARARSQTTRSKIQIHHGDGLNLNKFPLWDAVLVVGQMTLPCAEVGLNQ